MTQPLDTVRWVSPSTLKANDYNPNHVPPREFALLKQSILESGWTQPIVVDESDTIIDGFHRWTLASNDSDVAALTKGLVPTVMVPDQDDETRRMATIRHNRARGQHYVKQMAVIVNELIDAGLEPTEIETRLGMEKSEVQRLHQYGSSPDRNAGAELSKGWVPKR